MMTSKENEKKITKKDLNSVFRRTLSYNASFNYERQLNLGWAYGIAPILKKLYKDDKEKMSAALKRHLEFNNITPFICTSLFGITAAMEEENANNENFDADSINATKVSLMGPLSAVGDSIFFSTIRVIASSIGCSLSMDGNPIGVLVFLLIFNIPNILSRWYLLGAGYKMGVSFLTKVEKSGMIEKLFKITTILGLMVIGAMVSTTAKVPLAITFYGKSLLDIINGIIPNLLGLGLMGFIYYLLKKEVKVTYILVGIIVVGIAGAAVGIF